MACDSGGTEYDCPPAGLTVTLPPSLVGQVSSLELSMACADASVTPPPVPSSLATSFHVEPTGAGMCTLALSLENGTTFSDTVTLVPYDGGCGGLRTNPLGAATIAVPTPFDAGLFDAPND
jgi:hypothetical protein